MEGRQKLQAKLWHSLAVTHLGGKCVECGSLDNLEIHHIDNDYTNNKEENLEILCFDCHKKTFINSKYKGGRKPIFDDEYHIESRKRMREWRNSHKIT